MAEKGYRADTSEIGKVYYPDQGVELSEEIAVNYVEYPWITCFQVEGIRPVEEENNIYDEYLVINGKPEKVGTTAVDLTNYLQTDDLVEIQNQKIDEIFADL